MSGGLLRLRLDHLHQWVLDCLASNSSSSSLRLVKRSETHIYDSYLKGLTRLLEEPLCLDPQRPLGAVCRGVFGAAEEVEIADGDVDMKKRQQVVLYDKSLGEDEDKLRVLGEWRGSNF